MAVGPNHPSLSLPSTYADLGEARNSPQTLSIFLICRCQNVTCLVGRARAPYVLVDHRVLENDESSGCAHRPVKEGINGHTDEADLVAGVCPMRSSGEDVVEQLKQVRQVPDRVLLARRVFQVRLRMRHLGSSA